ncbi:hypothetical protein BU26DRAFT_609695 [Trematosphaeria pertusa]|uniref:RING-type domain-containing protein n=1 Tax=Trematosphaeria pertusa TaxID=390896 RepID=A0A6A6HZ45_9PLEO|nr:uncharacterized protein BU26DRAFT_609695 [Trematosphaeria pertusa]KAF2242982.1 hypothetical protein BU26DRAFT_609695 [Trematosphaeria pertusa]
MACFTSRNSFLNNGGLATVSACSLRDDRDCYICFRPYSFDGWQSNDRDVETPKRLPCGHIFGVDCILSWSLESNTCPYCRTVLFKPVTVEPPAWQPSEEDPLDSIDAAPLEPMDDWQHDWYEAMGFDPAYAPLENFGNDLGPDYGSMIEYISGTLDYQCFSICQQNHDDRCPMRHGFDQTTTLPSMAYAEADMFDVPQLAQDSEQPYIASNSSTGTSFLSHMQAFSQAQNPACFDADFLVDVDMRDDLAAEDADMDDLTDRHAQWMDELEDDDEDDYDFSFCCLQ